MAKIIECGAYCAENGSAADSIWASLGQEDFILEPLNPDMRITPVSVAAHTMYEQSHPFRFEEPDGTVDCSHSRFEQVDPRRIRVSGTTLLPRGYVTSRRRCTLLRLSLSISRLDKRSGIRSTLYRPGSFASRVNPVSLTFSRFFGYMQYRFMICRLR